MVGMTVAKLTRHTAIRRIVRLGRASTQQDLLSALEKQHVEVDQSTLSRDLAELDIRKSLGRYILPEVAPTKPTPVDYSALVHGFIPCGPHLIVMTTDTGQAQPIALAIDHAADPVIAGVLAGDDTIFIATKSSRAQTVAMRRLETWFGERYG